MLADRHVGYRNAETFLGGCYLYKQPSTDWKAHAHDVQVLIPQGWSDGGYKMQIKARARAWAKLGRVSVDCGLQNLLL